MIRTLIIDDEPLAHEVILTYVNELEDLKVVGQFYSATEALDYIKEHTVDLIFLDIEMPVLNGLNFLSLLKEKPQVIITSAYQEYAIDGFDMDVADYLLKPFRFDRFVKAVDRVRGRMNSVAEKQGKGLLKNDFLFIKVDKKQVQLSLQEVSCFEAYGNYVKVWRADKALLTPRTLSSFESELPGYFVRIHKSFIVNRAHINYIEGDEILLLDGKRVAIGKQFKANLQL
ncbi:LytTR family DNA-binding domain-containing protein [Pleionea sp. CnH1-48]|uniref:LytR/AlgR family response regulator transcription factor n=1 Tax=Pleionea sp. CnH1-48 TaxID=2954494 RepID=UPI0020981310|nr:LytTR family DNA-binding domain-containing protein [Pleionea sp. CnH1-48]MCO7226050.1 LytTR family DNA-binding domain-containing protein [Pleionea sp. CnH1-48]